MKATIHDVAKRLGVSIATVSLAVNQKKGISQETRQRVLRVAEEMGYHTAQLRCNAPRPRHVAFFLSGSNYNYFNSTFFTDILKHASLVFPPDSYTTLMRFSCASDDENNFRALLQHNEIDAVILLGRMPTELVETYAPNIPCVYINRPNVKGKNAYSVYADNQKAAYLVTRHMIQLGHRSIAFMGYLPHIVATTERFSGYQEALREADIPLNYNLVFSTEHFEETGYIEIRKLIASKKQLPSSIVCGNDLLAIGVMEALRDSGYSVPGDISVSGIHNLPHTELLRVPLTTVKTPHDLMGQQAAKLVMDILDGKVTDRYIYNDVELIVRSSTGPCTQNPPLL